MSSISDKSEETSKSVQRPITIIFFSLNRNLTRTELKKTFAVKKGKLFLAKKEHAGIAHMFDTLFAVRSSRPAEGLYFDHQNKNSITHIYVVAQGTYVKEFAILKYGTQLIGGFDVSKIELEEIEKILQAYRDIASSCMNSKFFMNGLLEQADKIIGSKTMDSCVYKDLLSKSAQELNDMTYPIISLAKNKVDEWFERYFWKDVDFSPEAVTDKPIQLSALDAEAS